MLEQFLERLNRITITDAQEFYSYDLMRHQMTREEYIPYMNNLLNLKQDKLNGPTLKEVQTTLLFYFPENSEIISLLKPSV